MEVNITPRKLPKKAKEGSEHTIVTNPGGNLGEREVTFKKTNKDGFGSWKITKNVKAD